MDREIQSCEYNTAEGVVKVDREVDAVRANFNDEMIRFLSGIDERLDVLDNWNALQKSITRILFEKEAYIDMNNSVIDGFDYSMLDYMVYSGNTDAYNQRKYIRLWMLVVKNLTLKDLLSRLRIRGFQIEGPAELLELLKKMNELSFVPKILTFANPLEQESPHVSLCVLTDLLHARNARFLHKYAIR